MKLTIHHGLRRLLVLCALCGLTGCAMPAFAKAMKPQKKISQDHFSCGENCPKSAKHVPRD